MQNLTPHFHGRHDFSAFCANRGDGSTPNPFKTMGEMKFEKFNRSIVFTLVADGFSYEMVQMLVESFMMLGLGSALGSGSVESAFGSETTKIFTKSTIYGIIVFFITAMLLTMAYVSRNNHRAEEGELPVFAETIQP
jgi:tRNA pseudouridine(38-40) synthase